MSKGGGDNGASQAAQTSANTQAAALNQIEQLIGSQQGMFNSEFAPLIAQLGGQGGAGSLSQLLTNSSSPSALATSTGINAPGITQNTLNYLGNTGGTNLAQVTPGLQSMISGLGGSDAFYQNEMTQGGGTGFQQASTNAQSQLQQQFAQSLSSILGNTAPGQNPAGAEQAAQNSLLSSSANLGSSLAGQEQGIMQQGAQGLSSNLLNEAGAQSSLASGLDTQTMQMLLGQTATANTYNQQSLGNEEGTLSPLLSFISQGLGLGSQALGSLGSIQSSAGTQQTNDINAANQAQQASGNAWSNILGSLIGGGAAGAGGAGSILKAFSDERLKSNIEPVGPRVDGLQAYSFLWRHDGRADVGFMAQDVERTHPEFVGETREGIKYVDYGAASDRFIRELERSLRAASV